MPVILDYEAIRSLATEATKSYLKGEEVNESNEDGFRDRDGRIHGDKGIKRAQKVIEYLTQTRSSSHDVLAVLLAVFGLPSDGLWGLFPSFGRSSRLAGLIADKLVSGKYSISHSTIVDTIESKVFAETALKNACQSKTAMRSIPEGGSSGVVSYAYTDRTRCVRTLLHSALEKDIPNEKAKKEILASMRKIKNSFNDKSKPIKPIDLSINEIELQPPTCNSSLVSR